ncbi:envelope stress response activation lipoprotein NlpE [Morganella psychrotolerans]|uniref:envelope stress response activation lipoprotein NlpE n=1 Tax=Morganella psychrotolerans TaxID=368603 RepID=UPI0039B0F54D
MKNLTKFLLAVGIFSITACSSTVSVTPTAEVHVLDRAYSGVVPCADCSAMGVTVLLETDGTYVMQRTYLETRDGNKTFFETGTWAKDGEKFRFTDTTGQRSYYDPQEKSLVMLDTEGNAIESDLNYTLRMVKPVQLKGEYRYLADAATFKDCETGVVYAVADNSGLERGYSKLGVEGGTPVYMEVEGYYSIRPSMEDGQFDQALIQTGKSVLDKSRGCK